MKKEELINEITGFDADLVWQIDKEKFYGFIGWDGVSSWWLKYNLEASTIKILSELLTNLTDNDKQ